VSKLLRGSNSSFRARIYERDRAVCALCDLDTEALAQRYRDATERDKAASQKYQCNQCEHVGTTHPCEECGGRLQRTVECFDARADVTREASRMGFKSVEFVNLMHAKQSLWVADHVMPINDGGDDDPDTNGRTLCVPCNRRVTAEQARQRAAARRVMRGRKNTARQILRAMKGRR
jgi:hypothetical protein